MKKLFQVVICSLLLLAFTGCSPKSEKIVIYTCQEEERIQAFKEALNAKFPDLDIVMEQVGTGNLAAKIKTEGSGIEADIIIDLERAHLENLKENFADLSGYDTSMFIDGINPIDNKYVIWVKQYAGITVDATYFTEKGWQYPESYADLLDSKYASLIAMPDPSTSGTGYSYYLNVVNIMGEQGALDYFTELAKNVKQFTSSGSGPISLLKQGEIAIAMGMIFQGVSEINAGSNYKIIELDTGAPYNMTGATIIEGHQDKANIKEVFQWIINEGHYIDVQQFVPGKVLKDQVTAIPNYVEVVKDADMTGLENINTKSDLVGKWELS